MAYSLQPASRCISRNLNFFIFFLKFVIWKLKKKKFFMIGSNDDYKLFSENFWPTRVIYPYFHIGPLSEIFIIANLRHTGGRIYKPAQNMTLRFVDWSFAVVITTSSWPCKKGGASLLTIYLYLLLKLSDFRTELWSRLTSRKLFTKLKFFLKIFKAFSLIFIKNYLLFLQFLFHLPWSTCYPTTWLLLNLSHFC